MALHRLLRDFLEPAADPRQSYRSRGELAPELLAGIREARRTVASTRAQFEATIGELRTKLPELERQARAATAEERHDLAGSMVERRRIAEAQLALLESRLGAADAEAERLAAIEQRLGAQIDSVVAREQMLRARQAAAAARVRVNETLAGISEEISGRAPVLADAEEQAEALEARAAAIERLLAEPQDW